MSKRILRLERYPYVEEIVSIRVSIASRTVPLCGSKGDHKDIYRVERYPYVEEMVIIRVSIE